MPVHIKSMPNSNAKIQNFGPWSRNVLRKNPNEIKEGIGTAGEEMGIGVKAKEKREDANNWQTLIRLLVSSNAKITM